jgi:hypothetical protein
LPLWPVAILTLKNRSLSPVVGRCIDCARGRESEIALSPNDEIVSRSENAIRPEMAHRVISRQRTISVAFGAKRTLSRIYEYTA